MKKLDIKRINSMVDAVEGVGDENALICQWCGKRFKNRAGLNMHITKCKPKEGETGSTIELRREKVISLLARGISKVAIAGVLGVSDTTIGNDIKAIQEDDKRRWSKLQVQEYLANDFAQIGFLEKMMKGDMFECKPDSLGRSSKQRDLLKLMEQRFKFLQETGRIPKVPDEFKFTVDKVDIDSMNKEQLDELEMKVNRRIAENLKKLKRLKYGK